MLITRNLTWTLPHLEKAYQSWYQLLDKGGLLLNFDADYCRAVAEDTQSDLPDNHAHRDLSDQQLQENDLISMELYAYQQPRPEWDVGLQTGRFQTETLNAYNALYLDKVKERGFYEVPANPFPYPSYNRNIFLGQEFVGFISMIHDEDKDIRNRILEVINTDETSVKGEFRLRCIDGSYSWFRMKGTVVRGHDGHPQRMIGSLINVDEQMNREMRLIEKAETDALTGVYNKGAFYDKVNEKLRSASDSDLFAIYMIDIDNFKAVNDDLGHAMGDQVLSDVAKKLCIVFSDRDCVGRIGGDEFAAFLRLSSKARNVGMSIIEEKAKAICDHLSDTYNAKKKEVSITASVGVSIYPYSGRDYNALFRKACKAMEKAKETGKNRYSIYSPDDT